MNWKINCSIAHTIRDINIIKNSKKEIINIDFIFPTILLKLGITNTNNKSEKWLEIPTNHNLKTNGLFSPSYIPIMNLYGQRISAIQYLKTIDMPNSKYNKKYGFVDSNYIYKIALDSDKYSYLILRTNMNPKYPDDSLLTSKCYSTFVDGYIHKK